MARIERMKGQNSSGRVCQTSSGGDVLVTAITGLSNLQVQETDDKDGMDVDVLSHDGQPKVQLDKQKKRRRKGKRKRRAVSANNEGSLNWQRSCAGNLYF